MKIEEKLMMVSNSNVRARANVVPLMVNTDLFF